MNHYDSRPPIFGRQVTSTFKKYFALKHKPPGNIRTCWIPPIVFGSVLLNLPKLLKLRFYLKKERKNRDPDDIRVAYYSDCLDETNGIANNLRHVIPYMCSHGMKAALVGNAFNTRPCGVIENGYCILLPRFFSMEQLGYANSELAIPRIGPILRLLKRYPIDLLELETPSPGAWLACIAAKVAGIKTISHYRTDVPTYTRTLVKAKWMHTYVLWLMRIFYWMARPVISPSEDYAKALRDELKVPEDKIQILPRGLPLDDFSPKNRGKGIWEKFGCNKSVRFVFIGRISKEKNLPFLNKVWKKFAAKYNDVELLYVGYGWYLEELKKEFENSPEVHFAGEQGGEILAGLYADADFFLFPSTTDTFGNVVVEAMASGTPAVVSNFGGPRSIVKDESNGFILPIDESAWLHTLEECRRLKLEQTEQYEILRKNAYERSRRYTLENSAKAQFAYFKTVLSKN
ncbi:MAG: glycosyltransferase [Fibrobacteraceae bacterium]|nr:glycosyltransferase [Fibrobacteraceae bacterium]